MTTPPSVPEIPSQKILQLYLDKNNEQVSEQLLRSLTDLEDAINYQLTPELQQGINTLVGTLLYIFVQPDYQLTMAHAERFLKINTIIANLVYLSVYGTTDPQLQQLAQQPEYIAKYLILLSARNQAPIDYNHLFTLHPHLACLWYSYFFGEYAAGLVNATVLNNLQRHLVYKDERINNFYNLGCIYFGATYIDGDHDRVLKVDVNQAIQRGNHIKNTVVTNQPHPKKVAVITGRWHRGHSVYRTLSQYVESLKPDYEITLIHTGAVDREIPIAPFDQIKTLYFQEGQLPLDGIKKNEFIAVYYPDVGMSDESIILSNLRLAPIQLCGTGHPVSTFGSKIDYFVSGVEVEKPDQPQENYSERLVLLPGLGCVHNLPTYQRQQPEKQRSELIINASWAAPKANFRTLKKIRTILERAEKPVLFRLFSSGVIRHSNYLAFTKDITAYLGQERVEVLPGFAYDQYMALMEEGDINLDPCHFGGSNIVSDSLHLRKLVVAVAGDKWYGRIGATMLKKAGLGELVAQDLEEYVEITLRLINDDDYRAALNQKLAAADLEQTVFSSEGKPYFKKMLDFLIEHHEILKADPSRHPIMIDP